ncbi:hypothetical protein E4U21_005419 [Claviceps maximensis]|nr:hypothetical protein E4U21_005419 [Claviceps maximensis]
MSTFYDDSDELLRRKGSQDAPEAVNRHSPVASRSSIDGELRRQYSMRSAQWPVSPIDLDTAKEVVTGLPMELKEATGSYSTHSSERQAASPVIAMTAMSPRTIWQPETEDIMPFSPRIASIGASTIISENVSRGEDANNDKDRADDGNGNGEEDGTSSLRSAESKPDGQRKIIGMRRHVFWIVLAVLGLMAVIGAVAGGVGIALASKQKNSATPSPPVVDPKDIQFLNNETWIRDDILAFQGFARPNFDGVASRIYVGDGTKAFAVNFPFDVYSFAWVPNFHHCCVNLCSNGTDAGRMSFVCGQMKQRVTTRPVSRVVVWCDDEQNAAVSGERGCGPVK